MLKRVVFINGNSRSGKDTYGRAIQNVLCSMEPRRSQAGPSTKLLAFASDLRKTASMLTNLPVSLFLDRQTKDTVLTSAQLEHAVRYVGDMNVTIRSPAVRIRLSRTAGSLHVEADLARLETWLKHAPDITPRDILKKVGSDGGIVPSWTWFIAVRQRIEALQNSLFEDYTAVITDLRRFEEFLCIHAYCKTYNIPTYAFRLEHWDRGDAGLGHITDTELSSNEYAFLFTKVYQPEQGMASMITVLGDMIGRITERDENIPLDAVTLRNALVKAGAPDTLARLPFSQKFKEGDSDETTLPAEY